MDRKKRSRSEGNSPQKRRRLHVHAHPNYPRLDFIDSGVGNLKRQLDEVFAQLLSIYGAEVPGHQFYAALDRRDLVLSAKSNDEALYEALDQFFAEVGECVGEGPQTIVRRRTSRAEEEEVQAPEMYMEILRKAQAQKLAEEKEEALRKLQSATQENHELQRKLALNRGAVDGKVCRAVLSLIDCAVAVQTAELQQQVESLEEDQATFRAAVPSLVRDLQRAEAQAVIGGKQAQALQDQASGYYEEAALATREAAALQEELKAAQAEIAELKQQLRVAEAGSEFRLKLNESISAADKQTIADLQQRLTATEANSGKNEIAHLEKQLAVWTEKAVAAEQSCKVWTDRAVFAEGLLPKMKAMEDRLLDAKENHTAERAHYIEIADRLHTEKKALEAQVRALQTEMADMKAEATKCRTTAEQLKASMVKWQEDNDKLMIELDERYLEMESLKREKEALEQELKQQQENAQDAETKAAAEQKRNSANQMELERLVPLLHETKAMYGKMQVEVERLQADSKHNNPSTPAEAAAAFGATAGNFRAGVDDFVLVDWQGAIHTAERIGAVYLQGKKEVMSVRWCHHHAEHGCWPGSEFNLTRNLPVSSVRATFQRLPNVTTHLQLLLQWAAALAA